MRTSVLVIMEQSKVFFSCLVFLTLTIVPYKCTVPIDIPDWFKLGVATSAYQVEGAWNVSGKTPNIWDEFTRREGNIADGSNADDACKSYEYWQRDIKMLKYLGVDIYRISISWTRMLPTGYPDFVNPAGLDYYNDIINALIDANIEPVVTIYHWDLPQNLQKLGGWMNPLVSDWLEDYARVLFESFGDRVKTWITLNESYMFGYKGYGTKVLAPGINAHGIGEYIAAKNMMMAHARVYHLYDEQYRATQKGQVGIVQFLFDKQPKTNSESDISAANDKMLFEGALYLDPIFGEDGGFPQRVIDVVAQKSAEQGYFRTRFPQLCRDEIAYIKGTSDFLGLNYYNANEDITRTTFNSGLHDIPSMKDDMGASKGQINTEIEGQEMPKGVRNVLLWLKERYNNPKIIITENGLITGVQGLKDEKQLTYHKKYLYTILNTTLFEDVNVVGYIAWSLMDVFEWFNGYTNRLGLFQTDFKDPYRKRTLRLAGAWYRDIMASRKIDLNYSPNFKSISF